jgi:hypothetical protein
MNSLENTKPLPGISIHINMSMKFELVRKLIDEVLNLHAKIVRFDIWWGEVLGEDGSIRKRSLTWYRSVVVHMVEKGLIPLAILGSGITTKRYVDKLIQSSKFSELVYEYSYIVAKTLSPYVYIFQLGNELNHPLSSIPRKVRYNFIESLCRGVNEGFSKSIKILNINIDVPRWRNYIKNVEKLLKECIDIVGIDHYPNTWRFVGYNYQKIFHLFVDLYKSLDKHLAITEIGFASELRIFGKTVLNREKRQKEFIENILHFLSVLANNVPINFIVWYMLWDEDPVVCEPFHGFGWCGWGILRRDFSKKPGWKALKTWYRYLSK